MSKPTGATIKTAIKAIVFPAKTLLLRVAAGKAEADGKTWDLSTHAGTNAPIVQLPDGRYVIFGWQDLMSAANQAGEQVGKKRHPRPIPEQPLDSIGE